jgi:hypothetical protein
MFFNLLIFLDVGQFVTTIQLDHSLLTGLPPQPLKPFVITTKRPEQSPTPGWISPPTRPAIQATQTIPPVNNDDRFGVFSNDFECGMTDYKAPTTTGLILGGQVANRGQFPWYFLTEFNTINLTS